jgi:very-short-patch-repair endonuclease
MAEEAERRGLFDLHALTAVIARNRRHRGRTSLTEVLSAWTDPPPVRSELERRFLELIESAELPRPHVNVVVAGLEVDFVWPEAGLIAELDGRRYHESASAFERDRLRDMRLATAGYRVVRITWRRLRDEPEAVIADLRRLLEPPHASVAY